MANYQTKVNSAGQESAALRFWKNLNADRSKPEKARLTARQLTNICNLLSTLLENGMPLQKAIQTLATDQSMKKSRKLLQRIQNRMTAGTSLHVAMSAYPNAFPPTVVQQVKLGEMSGKLADTLRRVVLQIEGWLTIRSNLFQKLSYPAMVITAGSGLMIFMLTVVVPQFEKIYSESKVSLPWITTVITGASRTLGSHLWLPLLPVILVVGLTIAIKTKPAARSKFHEILTRIPIIGSFVCDLAVLQFLRSVHALSEAGFKPIDAINGACGTVSNSFVRLKLEGMALTLGHGTKLSDALSTIENYVPSSVRQLMMVGEHAGNITRACEGSCAFLQSRLQRRINATMGMIEPALTIGMAVCIGWIVLAMYMPMFKMFEALDN